jgi:molecular chaperone GrpE
MTDTNARSPEAAGNEPPAEAHAAGAATAAAAAGEPSTDPTAALAQEAAEFRDRWMRGMAEMENLRRRTEREVADARAYGAANFARDVLAVGDNMRRALEAVTPETRAQADAGVKALLEGVELTERDLLKALEKNGIRKQEPQGQKFDPNLHQAMFEIPDATVPSGTVLQVVQAGYTIGDRVLRPALVGVSKGGPKAGANGGNGNGANDNGAAELGGVPT